jgi:membrane fusion protein (multidrug efflux system)
MQLYLFSNGHLTAVPKQPDVEVSVVKVRSFQPLERYNNYYVTQDFTPNTAIVYEGVQMMKDGITIKTDTIDMEAIRKEVELKQPIVK